MQQKACILLILCMLACLLVGCVEQTVMPESLTQKTNTANEAVSTRSSTSASATTTSRTIYVNTNNCTLIVDGKDITQGHYVSATIIDRDEYKVYTELPLVAVLEAAGWSTRWLNDTQVEVTYQGTKVVLDKEHPDFNLPQPEAVGSNGSPKVRKLMDGEMVVDGGSLMLSFLWQRGWRADFDMDARVINIAKRPDWPYQ